MPGKRILIIGETGAQGFAVAKALLLQAEEPVTVRIFSRNPDSKYARKLFQRYPQVESAKVSLMDFDAVERALQDVTVSLDYYLQSGNFDPKYATHHTNAEARVHTYLQGLPSPAHPSSNIAWTVLVTCAYDEDPMGGPCVPRMEGDGTRVFKLPLGDGSLPLVTLSDCAALALRIFQDRDRWSGKTINSVSPLRHRPGAGRDPEPSRQRAGPLRARVYDEWVDTLPFAGIAVAETDPKGITFEQNFRMWWPAFQHDLLPPTGDLAELKRSYPGLLSYEDWIRETGWDGSTGQFVMRLHDAGVTGKMQQSNYASWFRRIIPYVQRVQHLFS